MVGTFEDPHCSVSISYSLANKQKLSASIISKNILILKWQFARELPLFWQLGVILMTLSPNTTFVLNSFKVKFMWLWTSVIYPFLGQAPHVFFFLWLLDEKKLLTRLEGITTAMAAWKLLQASTASTCISLQNGK